MAVEIFSTKFAAMDMLVLGHSILAGQAGKKPSSILSAVENRNQQRCGAT